MDTTETAPKRTATRRGRWTYNSDSTYYGVAGWHLDGTPLVLDFMPGHGYDGRGEYQLYNDPCLINHHPVDRYMDGAMRWAEDHWNTEHADPVEPLPLDELSALNPALGARELVRLQTLEHLIAEDDQTQGITE